MWRSVPAILLAGAMALRAASSQGPWLSPEVREFVRVEAPAVSLTHVRVIDGTGAAPGEDQTVVIVDGRIESVGPSASATVPPTSVEIDLTGATVFPGLVGMHDHLFYPAPAGPSPSAGGSLALYHAMAQSFPRLYLAGGVTTIRTTGSIEPQTDLALAKSIDAGRIAGPKIRVTAPYLEGPGSFTPTMRELSSGDDARATVEHWANRGATSFKAYMHVTRAQLAAAIKAAHRRGHKVTGHLCSIGFREAAALGIDNLEHGLLTDTEFVTGKKPDVCPPGKATTASLLALDVAGEPVQKLIRDLVARRVAITSTLAVFETFVKGRPALPARVLEVLSPESRADYESGRKAVEARQDDSWGALLEKEMAFELAFAKAGGLLMTGADPTGFGGVVAGFADQRGIELLVEAGFSPVEAIRIATENGARFLGESARIGTITRGKQADLVVVRGDPSVSIADIENVEIVFKDGVGYDPARLVASVKGMVGRR